MCEPTTMLLVAGTAMSAMGAIKQGENAAAMGNYQNAQAQADGEAAQGEALVQARQIREAGKRQKSAATAASAASGFNVDDGTAELINNQIDQGAEQDALTTILAGKSRRSQLNAQGQMAAMQGENARSAGYISAIGSGLSAASGWKASQAKAAAAPTQKQLIHAGGY
jgi:hypothetical protein